MTKLPYTYNQLMEEVVANPVSSHWLRNALKAASTRDAVDALYDCKTLLFILKTRLNEIECELTR